MIFFSFKRCILSQDEQEKYFIQTNFKINDEFPI